MDSTTKDSPLEYPPCKVCGGTGAGVHYGVYTCQSCKTFFRRFLKREKPYVCSRDGNCKVVNSSRGNCSACRVQKCRQVGMSVEGVKIGRRTLKERNKTILEVNELQSEKKKSHTRFETLRTEVQARIEKFLEERPDLIDIFPWTRNWPDSIATMDKCSQCQDTSKTVVVVPDSAQSTSMPTNNIFYLFVQEAMMASSSTSNNNVQIDDKKSSEVVIDPEINREDWNENMLEDLLEECEFESTVSIPDATDVADDGIDAMDFCPLSPGSLEECFTELMEWTDQESQFFNQRSAPPQGQMPDSAIEDLVGTFKEMKVHAHLTDDEIKTKLKEEYEKMQLLTAAIGPMRSMTNEEYIDFFLTTGLDIEGRAKYLRHIKTNVSHYIKRVIKFAHKIPGFRDLLPKDQASLIRAAKYEVQVILMNRAVDPDLEMWMVWCGDVLDVNRSWMFGSMENRKKWFSLAKETRDLNLSTEEMAVVMGMSLTFTDRCSLCQPMEVDKINLNLTDHLQTLLKERYKVKASSQLCKIMELFVNLRSFSHERDAQLKAFVSNEVVKTHFPNLRRLQALVIE
ncbi:hypothetical protein FSP39_020467 [Pinctada imbricata]|uniref:Uncharacterized protein n=1 Tax=Pinctada imbricata TaxID=66713 RepID=A0AA89C0N1_PINIB|nr:hypothetical protein FSP39_020467 [Pinctada imbricata]